MVDFCVILQLSQTAIFPLMVTFLEHEQQELYLVTLLIPRISAIVSVVVEISVTSGSFSLNHVQHPSWCTSCLVLVCSSTFDSEILSFSGC